MHIQSVPRLPAVISIVDMGKQITKNIIALIERRQSVTYNAKDLDSSAISTYSDLDEG